MLIYQCFTPDLTQQPPAGELFAGEAAFWNLCLIQWGKPRDIDPSLDVIHSLRIPRLGDVRSRCYGWQRPKPVVMNGDSETWQVALVMGAVVVVLIVLSFNAQ